MTDDHQYDLFHQSPAAPEVGHFAGATIDEKIDPSRLAKQSKRVFNLMKDGGWRTLEEIELVLRYPQASISARLRDFRKKGFGGHRLNKEPLHDRGHGLYIYQLIVRTQNV